MKQKHVGEIKNIVFDSDEDHLEVTVVITDAKYKKKFLRDLHLSGHVEFVGNKLVYIDKEGDKS